MAALIGVCGGFVALLFHSFIVGAESFLQGHLFGMRPFGSGLGWIQYHLGPYGALLFALLPAAGAFISALLVYRFAPEAAGDGTYATIENFHRRRTSMRKRVPGIKLLASVATISSGGSAGHEGPVAQIGAGISSLICRLFRMSHRTRRMMLLAGTAAGLGAIFKAPLGGALTSVEVLYKEDFESDAFITSIVASVIAFAVYTAFVGTVPVFSGIPSFEVESLKELLAYAALGIFCTPVSWLYVRIFYGIKNKFARWDVSPYLKPVFGGLLVGLIWILRPEIASGGWHFLRDLIHGDFQFDLLGPWAQELGLPPLAPSSWLMISVLAGIVLAKITATALTVGSGAAGGIFGPSLFIGGMTGALVGNVFHLLNPAWAPYPQAFILVGMGAFFAGAANAPIASVIMVCEMTGSYSLLAPLLLASVIHLSLSRNWSLYPSQVHNRFHSPVHRGDLLVDVLHGIQVADVLQSTPVRTLSPTSNMAEVERLLLDCDDGIIPVSNLEGTLVGILDANAARNALKDQATASLVVAQDLMMPPTALGLHMNLHQALHAFLHSGHSQLPVMRASGGIIGLLRHGDVLRAYDEQMRIARKR